MVGRAPTRRDTPNGIHEERRSGRARTPVRAARGPGSAGRDCQPYLPELFQARLNLGVDGVIRLQNYAATAEDRP